MVRNGGRNAFLEIGILIFTKAWLKKAVKIAD
jgi:hypothetical protein